MRNYSFICILFTFIFCPGVYADDIKPSLEVAVLTQIQILQIVQMIDDDIPLSKIIEDTKNFATPISSDIPIALESSVKSNGMKKTLFAMNDIFYDEIRKVNEYEKKLSKDSYGGCISNYMYTNYILKKIDQKIPISLIIEKTDPAFHEQAVRLYDASNKLGVLFTLKLNNDAFVKCISGSISSHKP